MLGKSNPQVQHLAQDGGEGKKMYSDGVHRALITLVMFYFSIWMVDVWVFIILFFKFFTSELFQNKFKKILK